MHGSYAAAQYRRMLGPWPSSVHAMEQRRRMSQIPIKTRSMSRELLLTLSQRVRVTAALLIRPHPTTSSPLTGRPTLVHQSPHLVIEHMSWVTKRHSMAISSHNPAGTPIRIQVILRIFGQTLTRRLTTKPTHGGEETSQTPTHE